MDLNKLGLHLTGVLPIVKLQVGAIGNMLPLALVRMKETSLNRITFNRCTMKNFGCQL